MIEVEKEIAPGLTSSDVKQIADNIFNRTDGNHPQLKTSKDGFLDILQNGTSDISASSIFIKKAAL